MRVPAGMTAGAFALAACGGAGGASATAGPSSPPKPAAGVTASAASACSGATSSRAPAGMAPSTPAGLGVPSGFTLQTIARIGGAREIAPLPNGDLIVGTGGSAVYIVPNAEAAAAAGAASVFATVNDAPAAGVAFSQPACTVYIATQHGIYATPYRDGDLTAERLTKIGSVRSGSISPTTDGDVHRTTSVAAGAGALYVGVGSSCNACVETDPTRASIQRLGLGGGSMTTIATRIRNPIALAIDPVSGHLWAGDAGQDDLPSLHPYEFLDDVTSHGGVPDYGWPDCEEHHVAYVSGSNCSQSVAPLVELPAYSTIIGAAFYPPRVSGAHAFGPAYAGALFVARHGSWHTPSGCNVTPEVDVVPMHGDVPATPVNWGDPHVQWKPFVTGFQPGCSASTRIGRPTGIAVGPAGSLFIGDDRAGLIYRVRP